MERVREQGQDEGVDGEGLKEENRTLRNELQQFHQLKQLLGGGQSNNGASPVATDTTTAPAPAATVPMIYKRVQNEELAIASIDKAISLIMDWNDQHERTFNEKWYLSIPALQELLRGSGYTASQPRVKAALDNRRKEIDQHHAQHRLGSRHNRKHQRSITNVMTLP